jgi:CRISPR type I-E-associated protein CasB/Cse2
MSDILNDAKIFVANLGKLDRGEMATVRKCITKHRFVEGGIVIEPLITHVNSESLRECYYWIAALFAFHPENLNEGNMGTTCKTLAVDTSGNIIPSRKQKFYMLVTSQKENLFSYLFSYVRMAASMAVPINYAQLLCDLFWWEREDKVQHQWNREFARGTKNEQND